MQPRGFDDAPGRLVSIVKGDDLAANGSQACGDSLLGNVNEALTEAPQYAVRDRPQTQAGANVLQLKLGEVLDDLLGVIPAES